MVEIKMVLGYITMAIWFLITIPIWLVIAVIWLVESWIKERKAKALQVEAEATAPPPQVERNIQYKRGT